MTAVSGIASDPQAVERLRRLSRLMDSSIQVPGTRFRVGLDPILGLVPGIGDALPGLISLYIIYEGWRLGATGGQLIRMLANVLIDVLIGSIPLVGDLFDFGFKANRRNLRILGIQPATD